MVADQPGVQVTGDVSDPTSPIIRLAGELDLASVESAKEGMAVYLAGAPVRVTLDLEKLIFMDSSGIALLVQVSNDIGQVSLTNVAPIVHRVLEATGLLEHFGLVP